MAVVDIRQTRAKPIRRKMSYEEYLVLAGDSRIMEWSDGEGIEYMPPGDRHQDIVRFLSAIIDTFVSYFDLGILRFAPFEVKLWPDGPSREPDILVISTGQEADLGPLRFLGAPDLVIEIISDSSVTEDRVHKFRQYEQAGVREYWIIDPRPFRQQADFYTLDDKSSLVPAEIDDQGIFHSSVLPQFWLRLSWLWQDTLPDAQLVLAEIMMGNENLAQDARDTYSALYDLLRTKQ